MKAAVVDLGILLPPRFEAVADYARRIGVDAGTLLTIVTGCRPFDPVELAAPAPAPDNVRMLADAGRATWPEAVSWIGHEFPRHFQRSWDEAAYLRHQQSGPGAALRVAVVRALRALRASGVPVVLVATCPAEFAGAMRRILIDGTPVVCSAELGVARPDPSVWQAALAAAGVAAEPPETMIAHETWDSGAALAGADGDVGEVWWVTEESLPRWTARLHQLCSRR